MEEKVQDTIEVETVMDQEEMVKESSNGVRGEADNHRAQEVQVAHNDSLASIMEFFAETNNTTTPQNKSTPNKRVRAEDSTIDPGLQKSLTGPNGKRGASPSPNHAFQLPVTSKHKIKKNKIKGKNHGVNLETDLDVSASSQ